MKCFLGISSFLEKISSLSRSIVFPYFFALITEEGFLISPWYLLSHQFMANRWGNNGTDFIFLGSKVTADGDGSHEIKRCLTEDEMAGWHHWLNGRESEWTPGVGDGQGGLACCDSWGPKESDTTERVIWSDLLLGKKTMTNLDSILKSRDISLPTNVHLIKAMVFPVVMHGCENWTLKKAVCPRIDAFGL